MTLSLLNPKSRACLRPIPAPAYHQRSGCRHSLPMERVVVPPSLAKSLPCVIFPALVLCGVVGACRLDLAYEHFKEKPHLFQFVPNEKHVLTYSRHFLYGIVFKTPQPIGPYDTLTFSAPRVKEANKLLKTISQDGERRKVDGVPVLGAQNLDSAVATTDGIKWYTLYFFDENMLDNILEDYVDKHFHALTQTRHMQRQPEVIEEIGDTMWEPLEVQDVLDEVGHPAIPLSDISKAAEIQLLYVVDKALLGNRWLRKVTGIQPKFPSMVDSFERR
ncbi:hypothetical protein V6N13_108644 [Hibiscus sabdariffa]